MRTHTDKRKGIGAVNLAGILVAVSLFGYALSLISVPAQFMRDSLAAASVSINVGVAPNPDNTVAEQLKEKAAQLDTQQKHIQQLQQSLGNSSNDTLGWYSLFASMFLTLLVVANFYFDWRRSRGLADVLTRSLTVDLRALQPR